MATATATATADPEADYRRALDATVQWLQQYHYTKSSRDRATALICSQIAREKFETLQQRRDKRRDYRQLVLIERRAEMDSIVDEITASIAECRQILEAWPVPEPAR